MKIFWMEDTACLLANMVWMGMCDLIGEENITLWPDKDWYHLQGAIRYIRTVPKRPISAEQADELFRTADIVVLAGPREQNTKLLAEMIARLGRPKRIVIQDGEDYTQVNWPAAELIRPDVYLKLCSVPNPYQGWLTERVRIEGHVRIVPFALATSIGVIESRPKTLDVSLFGGNHWHRGRVEGVELTAPWSTPALVKRLDRALGKKFVYRSAAPWNEFIDGMAKSKISIVVGGHGIEPLRTVEVMSCPDTLCARQDIAVISPWPFRDKETVVVWEEMDPQWDGLVRTLEYYLEHEDERLRIARAGNAYVRDHFQPKHRAQDLIDEAMK